MNRPGTTGSLARDTRAPSWPGGGHLTTPLAPRPVFPSASDVAAALATSLQALGVRRTAAEVAPVARRVGGRDAAGSLPSWLEEVAGREVAEDELFVAREAFVDHLSISERGNRR